METEIEIRECTSVEEFTECVALQREVFALPQAELSPVRHLVVTKNAGGFVLGAYDGDRLAGFTLSVPAFVRGQRAIYSHMTGVRPEYQSHGLGARLKWAQRDRALAEGVRYIKWTFEPTKARNAYFNLEKLGAVVREYVVDFYGTDYDTAAQIGLASDRVFAEWHLDSEKVEAFAAGKPWNEERAIAAEIRIMNNWLGLVESDRESGMTEQMRIRKEFQAAFERGLVVQGFRRDAERPAYLLYEN